MLPQCHFFSDFLQDLRFLLDLTTDGNELSSLYNKIAHMLKRPVGRPPKKPIVLYHTQKGETIMAKKTRNASIFIAEPKGPFLKGVLILALWISIALGVPVSGDTTVVGTGDPAVDLPAVQAAVDDGGTVTLKNGGANGDIAFIPEWVVREVVFRQVVVNVAIVPIQDWIDLHDLVLLLGDAAFLAGGGLISAQAR